MTVEVNRTEEGLRLTHLDLFFLELLRQIPVSADPGECEAARERLYPAAGSDEEANGEWREYVKPDLEEHFKSATTIVREDLERCEQPGETADDWSFQIPAAHFDQWLNALNQARLALAARFDFGEREMDRGGPRTLETVRDLSLFQIHFYGFLQECLLQDMQGEAD